MEKAKEVLWSLIPLLLIILFSWLFSLMGSKVKKQAQGKEPPPKEVTGSPILDMLLNAGQPEEEPQVGAPFQNKENSNSPMPPQPEAWRPPRIPGQTRISSEPITPKWWGA